jgi:hypothetical protein
MVVLFDKTTDLGNINNASPYNYTLLQVLGRGHPTRLVRRLANNPIITTLHELRLAIPQLELLA